MNRWPLRALCLAIAAGVMATVPSLDRTPAGADDGPPPTPPTTIETTTTTTVVEYAEVAAVAVRITPPISITTAPQYDQVAAPLCANPEGLRCLPFYDGDPTDLCAEMNFYIAQDTVLDAEPRFSDQPRDKRYPKQMGIGWRESNCNNGVRTSCCFGYFQIAIGNRTAYGYAAAGVFQWCGVRYASDFFGQSPLAKQKQVCVASGLYQYHVANGPYPLYPWDSFL